MDKLDGIDRAILRELERDGRINNKDIAAKVGIAPSTCHTRMRRLKNSGVILGVHAHIDPRALGSTVQALITVRLHANARSNLSHFHAFLETLPQARSVYFLAGDRDFLVHLAVTGVEELRDVVAQTISVREEVASTNTSLIFEHSIVRP